MNGLQTGNVEVDEWNRGEAMAASMFNQLEGVLQAPGTGAARLERIKSVILPQLPPLIAAQKPNALISQEFMERTALGLYMFATQVLKAEQDRSTAMAALQIARKLTTSKSGESIMEENLAALSASDGAEVCLACGGNAHPQCAVQVKMFRASQGVNARRPYESVKVPVPRCESCKNKDDSVGTALVVAPLVTGVVALFCGNTYGGGGFFLGGIGGVILAFGVFLLMVRVLAQDDEAITGYSPIKERLDAGWRVGSPPLPGGRQSSHNG